MKKLLFGLFALVSISSLAAGEFNVYGKFGVDLHSNFSKIKDDDGETVLPKKAKSGYSFFLEGTTEIAPNLEFGLGLGYVARKGKNYSYDDDFNVPPTKVTGRMVSYDSIPLYLTTKYNLNTGTSFKPYGKIDLGYSFNKINKTDEYENGVKIEGDDGKMKNGIYFGVGLGVEYNNFLTELSYHLTKSKWTAEGESDRFDNKAVRLSVGYKFNF